MSHEGEGGGAKPDTHSKKKFKFWQNIQKIGRHKDVTGGCYAIDGANFPQNWFWLSYK